MSCCKYYDNTKYIRELLMCILIYDYIETFFLSEYNTFKNYNHNSSTIFPLFWYEINFIFNALMYIIYYNKI